MMGTFTPGSAGAPTSEVELTISCRNLRDMDVFSKSDPMCIVYLKSNDTLKWQEIKKTEVVNDNLNPDFATKIVITYHFEEQQHLRFDVFDVDSNNLNSLQDHDFIGGFITTLGQIVASSRVRSRLSSSSSHDPGEIIIVAEELSSCKDEVVMRFIATNLDRKDFFGWSDPFLEIYKVNENNEEVLVHRTEVIKWASNARWNPITVQLRNLCGGDLERSIEIRCLDWNRFGKNKLIGKLFTTMNELKTGSRDMQVYSLIHPKKQQRSSSYSNSGTIKLIEFKYIKVYSFLDYVLGGTTMNCTIAIDFTASNGDPKSPQSNHFISSYQPNQYEQALSAVVEIIEDYNSSKLFPVLGFGARLPPIGSVSHEFFVNLHPDNPYCRGVEGVLEAYKSCLRQIQLFGPTNFSPVINHVSKFAQTYQDGSQYFILLIITDGIITDMPQTIKAIVYASTLPMSIIIVGVGNEDFSAMEVLDADVIPLRDGANCAARDIVQFVRFNDFQKITNVTRAKAHLAKEVLAEIPDQLVGYMRSKNIVPKAVSSAPPPPYEE